MPNTYHAAPAVQMVAESVIAAHHRHLINNGVYVKFLFCEDPEKVKGREALGTARKVSGLNAHLALTFDEDAPRADYDDGGTRGLGKLLVSEFFLIIIYRDFWRSRNTTDAQRTALVDHELSHCWSEEQTDKDGNLTGKILLSTLPHDLEEFNLIFSRYGAWRPDIQDFLNAGDGEQLSFDDLEKHIVETKGTTVTLTTRQGSVTVSSEKLAEQAERSRG